MITIRTFDNTIDAHLLKTKLESEGIECFLFDENTVSVNPLYNITVGGIKLKINERDLEKTRGIISLIEDKPLSDANDQVITCPNCESKDVHAKLKSSSGFRIILDAFVSFLILLIPSKRKTDYSCKSCGTVFRK